MRYRIVNDGVVLSQHRLWSRAFDAFMAHTRKARQANTEFHGCFIDTFENRVVIDGIGFFQAYPLKGGV
jgi:hypothetical protein